MKGKENKMEYKTLFEAVEQLEEKYIKMWEDICLIESPTTDKAGVDAVGKFCTDFAKEMGWKVQSHHEELSGDPICITMNPDSTEPAICLSAHMDTVHPVGSFGTPAVRLDDTYIYGPGVRDCKGGIVASFMIMEAMQKCGYNKRPIKLILQSDEENSSATSQKRTVEYMAKMAEGCLAFFNLESFEQNKVTVQRKGIMKYRFDITGTAGHAGKCYDYVSAIREAAYKIVEVEKWKEREGVTCNVGTITGGTGINVVPETCSFQVDVRFVDEQTRLQISDVLQQIADKSYVEGSVCKLTLVSMRAAMPKFAPNDALVERMNEIFAQTGLPVLEPTAVPGGSDCSDLVTRGITGVDSLGIEGSDSHSLKEKAELASLVRCGKRMAALIQYL